MDSTGSEGKRRLSIMDSDSRKKSKKAHRPLSPSIFYDDDPPALKIPSCPTAAVDSSTIPFPNSKERVDAVLNSVAQMYYKPTYSPPEGAPQWLDGRASENLDYSTITLLKSPLRKPNVLDDWSPKELALFEAGITSVGKDFFAIHQLIKTKTTNQVVDFYYTWKQSSHFLMWKEMGKQTSKLHNGKQEQWQMIEERMRPVLKASSAPTLFSATPAAMLTDNSQPDVPMVRRASIMSAGMGSHQKGPKREDNVEQLVVTADFLAAGAAQNNAGAANGDANGSSSAGSGNADANGQGAAVVAKTEV